MHVRAMALALPLVLAVTSTVASAQRRGFRNAACMSGWDPQNYFISPFFQGNTPYDGRVTFARIKYQGNYECGNEGPGWAHDYPRTDSHFMRILKELSSVRVFVERPPMLGSVLVRLDEPEMLSYPIAYLSEPGGWMLTDAEQRGLKRYIQNGGFIIFDDIEGDPNPDYRNLLTQWRRVFPTSRPVQLTNDHPIFNSFFRVDLSKIPSKMGRVAAEYWGFFEDNDPSKRLVAIIDNYADVGELIEFSDEGFNVVPANEAYKLWVNYFVYALTH